jgi:hypothetical protein
MKVIKGIDKGVLRKFEYNHNNWGKGLDESVKVKLRELSSLISKINKPVKEWDEMDQDAWRLNEFFKRALQIEKITFVGKTGTHDVNSPLLIQVIVNSLDGKVKIKKPKNSRPISDLKRLLQIGGYEIIVDLKRMGFSDRFLMDFIQSVVKDSSGNPKISVVSLESFKTALSDFKKSLSPK